MERVCFMNKLLAFLLFPFIWAIYYLYRIICFNLLKTLLNIILDLFHSPLSSLWLLITLPIVLAWEIPVGLIMTFIVALSTCKDIYVNNIDITSAFKVR